MPAADRPLAAYPAPDERSKEPVRKAQGAGSKPLIPEEIEMLLGPRPLLSGECSDRYDGMFASFVVEFEPDGVIEWLLLRDVHDLTWELQRIRCIIAVLIDTSRHDAFNKELDLLCVGDDEFAEQMRDAAARAWSLEAIGKAELVQTTHGLLSAHGMSLDSLKARAVRHAINEVSALEKICASLERRRFRALNEFHAYRIQLRHLARLSVSRMQQV